MIISFLAELYKPIRILWWAFEVTVEVLWEVGNTVLYQQNTVVGSRNLSRRVL
jgi:hypothetical protein